MAAVWLLICVPVVIMWYVFIVQVLLGTPVGTSPAPSFVTAALWLVFGVGLPFSAYATKLITYVITGEVRVRFFPWYSRKVPLNDIAMSEVRRYRPLAEYGGWGIRWGLHMKQAYIMSGDMGVELELSDGERLLVGSKRPDELANAITTAKSRH